MDEVVGAGQLFEFLLDTIKSKPRTLQHMIDAVIAVQDIMPMPEDAWEQFRRDIAFTNEKHGYQLVLTVPHTKIYI